MRKLIITMIIISTLIVPASAIEYTAPTVPQSAESYMPADTESFGEGVWYIFKKAITS